MTKLPAHAAAVATRPAPRRIGPPTPRVALVIATVVLIGVVLYMARHALTPFIIGALLIYLLDPAVGWFSRLRLGRVTIPRWLAVLIVYAITAFVVVEGLLLLLGPLVTQLLDYVRDFPALLRSFEDLAASLGEMYRNLDLPEPVREFIDDLLADIAAGAGGIDFGALLPIARTIAGTAAGFFGFLIIPIWAFYILRDRMNLTQGFLNAFPLSWRDEIWAVMTIVERVFGRWIRGQLLLGLIVGAATFAGLLVLGWLVDPRFLQFAVLLAVIAGILELLPIIGPIISMIPTLLIALTTQDPVLSVIAVLILYIAVQQIENNILVPKIQGDAVELHPSLVIFALVIGGSIAGFLGAILSIPITAAIKDVYSYLFLRLSDDAREAEPEEVADASPPMDSEPDADPSPAEDETVAADDDEGAREPTDTSKE
jgi:predicted PurR-regulated permease PerM